MKDDVCRNGKVDMPGYGDEVEIEALFSSISVLTTASVAFRNLVSCFRNVKNVLSREQASKKEGGKKKKKNAHKKNTKNTQTDGVLVFQCRWTMLLISEALISQCW